MELLKESMEKLELKRCSEGEDWESDAWSMNDKVG